MSWLERGLMTGPYLALCLNEGEYHQCLADLGVNGKPAFQRPGSLAFTHYFDNDSRAPACIVCLVDEGTGGIDVATSLIHEAVHVWQIHCEYLGEAQPSKEFEAYSIEQICRTLMQAYVERRLKR